MFGKPKGHIFCLLTLRHTGSQCSVVILTNNNSMSLLSGTDKKILECLGANFFFTELLQPDHIIAFWSFRKQVAYDYLKKYKHLYRRVISIDFFDTFFQNDPFCDDLPFDSMALSVEEHQLKFNVRAPNFKKLWPETKFHFSSKLSLNGGTFGGGIEPVFKYLEFYMKKINFDYRNFRTDDQTYLDYYVYDGHLDKAGIKYIFDVKGVLSSMYEKRSFGINTTFGYVTLRSNGMYLRACHLWKFLPHYYIENAYSQCK